MVEENPTRGPSFFFRGSTQLQLARVDGVNAGAAAIRCEVPQIAK